MSKETLKKNLRNIPDFPIKGIQFKDVTSWFVNNEYLSELVDLAYQLYKDKGITKVVGIESRGFVLGGAIAIKLGAGFVPARKPGKLPSETISESYQKEYGKDIIEIHKDAINENDVVLIHDDLLATGGTMLAAYRLSERFTPKRIYVNFLVELTNLKGRDIFPPEAKIQSLISIEEDDI